MLPTLTYRAFNRKLDDGELARIEARLAVLQHNLQVFQAKACMLVGLLLCAALLAPLPTA